MGEPNFLLLESDQNTKIKLSANLKIKILYSRLRATLKGGSDSAVQSLSLFVM